jgi:tetratricopeptide (TPR) repeat protein
MNKFSIPLLFLALMPFQTLAANTPATDQQLMISYNYAYSLYQAQKFDQAEEVFRKLASAAMQPAINANSLFYYSQCAFRTGNYDGCVKGLDLLVKRWPQSAIITKGYVSQFATFLIDQVAAIQTNWDYYRYKDGTDEKGEIQWKESVPVGYKIKRINFKLGFGLYKILQEIQPNSSSTVLGKQKLVQMLNLPIKILWTDEKAPPSQYGHPADFFSIISPVEKSKFSKTICDRIFYNWKTDKLCDFFDTYDDVENLNPKYVAKTKEFVPSETGIQPVYGQAGNGLKPPMLPQVNSPNTYTDPTAVLTLANLFLVSGYNPYTDTYSNLTETQPALPGT